MLQLHWPSLLFFQVFPVQDKICEDVCIAASHGQYGRKTYSRDIGTSAENLEIGVHGDTLPKDEQDEFLDDEIDDWDDTT